MSFLWKSTWINEEEPVKVLRHWSKTTKIMQSISPAPIHNNFIFSHYDGIWPQSVKLISLYCWSGQRANLMANLDSACWKTPLCKFLEQLGQLVAFDSILQFLLDDTCMWFCEAAPIITYTTGVILGSNFRYQNKEINYRILIKYGRDDITCKLFRNNVTMKENKIQIFI